MKFASTKPVTMTVIDAGNRISNRFEKTEFAYDAKLTVTTGRCKYDVRHANPYDADRQLSQVQAQRHIHQWRAENHANPVTEIVDPIRVQLIVNQHPSKKADQGGNRAKTRTMSPINQLFQTILSSRIGEEGLHRLRRFPAGRVPYEVFANGKAHPPVRRHTPSRPFLPGMLAARSAQI